LTRAFFRCGYCSWRNTARNFERAERSVVGASVANKAILSSHNQANQCAIYASAIRRRSTVGTSSSANLLSQQSDLATCDQWKATPDALKRVVCGVVSGCTQLVEHGQSRLEWPTRPIQRATRDIFEMKKAIPVIRTAVCRAHSLRRPVPCPLWHRFPRDHPVDCGQGGHVVWPSGVSPRLLA